MSRRLAKPAGPRNYVQSVERSDDVIWRQEIAPLTTVPDGGYAIHKGRTLTVSDTSYSWFDHDRRLPERGFLRDGTPYRNLAGILARLKIGQRNTEAQRNRF